MSSENQSPSQTLQHQQPLTEKEIKQLTHFFEELVMADNELKQAEKERGAHRAETIAQETSDAFDHLIVDNEMNMDALETIGALQHQEKSSGVDKKYNVARQKFLHKVFQVVEYLRILNEYVAWECDFTLVINAMEKLHNWLQGIIQLTQDETFKQQSRHLQEEIEQHRDPSSELFLRMAEGVSFQLKGEEPYPLQLNHKVANELIQAYGDFRKMLHDLSQKKPVFPNGYKSFVLSLKAFGLAFKNYKGVSGAFTASQCLQIFAPVGEEVSIHIPPIEK
jgi:hypothetical protein